MTHVPPSLELRIEPCIQIVKLRYCQLSGFTISRMQKFSADACKVGLRATNHDGTVSYLHFFPYTLNIFIRENIPFMGAAKFI
jgi:hypothetical protein